jgi:hypothetical protein
MPLLTIASAVFVAGALLFLIREAYFAIASAGWPVVNGLVLESSVRDTHADTGPSFVLRVRYRYSVGSCVHEARRTHFGTPFRLSRFTFPSRVHGEVGAERYRQGAVVSVHVHPARPNLSTLASGAPWDLHFSILFLACLLGLLIRALI